MLAFSNRICRALICTVLCALPWGCASLPDRSSPSTPRPVVWTDLPAWPEADLAPALSAFRKSCEVMATHEFWSAVCAQATRQPSADARAFFEQWFTPQLVVDDKGQNQGLLTGYYEPLLLGSLSPTPRFRHAVYSPPEDLLRIEVADVYPELSRYRLRGRLADGKITPYFSRGQIDSGQASLAGHELVWVDDPIALFFLHIQGAGKVALADGGQVRVGYADQNGHPYRAIGKVLIDRGELRKEHVSLQTIRDWLQAHPDEATEVMASNPSYVFFQLRPDSTDGPIGTQGVPLSAGHSIAVDTRHIALGTPVYIESTWPTDGTSLRRLVVAQDTGGAINGAVRADLFLGNGPQAEQDAGTMKQPLRLWVLRPKFTATGSSP
ncbi:MAG: transglycosylase [Betaproteobacteria bacterium]|nr:transglycosylase [Betaproteobacteria bacterium]